MNIFRNSGFFLFCFVHFSLTFEVMIPGVVGKKDYCSSWISKQGGEKSNFLKCLRKVIADELPHAGRGGGRTYLMLTSRAGKVNFVSSRLSPQAQWRKSSVQTPSSLKTQGKICLGANFLFGTPWKINMEPTNHPFSKENDLPNLHGYVPC